MKSILAVLILIFAVFVSRIRLTLAVFGAGAARLKRDLPRTRLGKSMPVMLVVRVIQELGDDDATHMAASVSYYTILSLFPLVLGLSAITGMVANSAEQQEAIIEFIVQYLPGSEAFVRESVDVVIQLRPAIGIVSVLSLFWAGSAVFGSITRAVNRAWDVQRDPPFYKNKPRQIAMAMGISLLFLFSVGITGFFQWATSIEIGGATIEGLVGGWGISAMLRLPALVVSFTIFAIIYKVVPNTKTEWRDIWLGAVIATVLFEFGKNMFLLYLEEFAQFDQLYGNIASVVILMVWAYLSSFILILGAEITSEYNNLRVGEERGHAPPAAS